MAHIKSTSVSVVPWFNGAQFKKVYEYLFSDEITKKKWAVDTISVWETRCHPSLPTAIEATYVLTSAVIQDILWTNKTTLIHHTDLQGIYGSAITRFVNLIAETNKKKELPFYSVAELAKSIGIPSFIVDIRNEWCHSTRPSLSNLRLATQSALKYLKESYWAKEAARVINYAKQPLDDRGLIHLFEEFIKYHEDTLKSIKTRLIPRDDGSKILNKEYAVLLIKLGRYLEMNKRLFVKVLIYDGIFIPKDEKFKGAVSIQEYTMFDTECYLNDDDDDDEEDDKENDQLRQAALQEAFEFESKNFPEVPHYHVDLWHPVIALLNQYDSVPLFMEELLKSQGDRTIVGQKLLIAWILKILRIHERQPSPVHFPLLKKIFRSKGIVPNWLSMLHSALINPCKYTLIILPLILSKVCLKEEEAHRIIGLISLKLGMVPIENRRMGFCKLYHSAEDLKKALENQRKNGGRDKQKRRMKQNKKNENICTPFPDDCHKLWPIGFIVNAVKDTDDSDEEEEDVFAWTSTCASEMEISYDNKMHPSNKNEDEDEDDTCKINDEPDLSKIMLEIDRRQSVLYKRSG